MKCMKKVPRLGDRDKRRYKKDFIKYLVCAHASCNESLDHLEILYETKSLKNDQIYSQLHKQMNQ